MEKEDMVIIEELPPQPSYAAGRMRIRYPYRGYSPETNLRAVVLIWLCFHNVLHTFLMRYSRSREVSEMYLPSVAVFIMEMIKLCICVAIELYNEGCRNFCESVKKHTTSQPWNTLKVCVPAIVYVIQNNLFYVSASHLQAATFMILSQLKIFTTALFSFLILRKSLSGIQWAALFVLFAGVSLVQLDASSKSTTTDDENPLIGFSCILAACVLSGFACVYFEKILKASGVSLWMRNIQLSLFAVPSSLLSVYTQDGDFVKDNGMLYGFDIVVWFTVLWYAIGGLSVAACIKYADNIAKNFSTSVSIILSTFISVIFFSFYPTYIFLSGTTFAILSIFMYSSPDYFKSIGTTKSTSFM